MTRCRSQHQHHEFLTFLRYLDVKVPQVLAVRLICNNYSTHKHAWVKAWLTRRSRFHLHVIPTYSAWLNQVELGLP